VAIAHAMPPTHPSPWVDGWVARVGVGGPCPIHTGSVPLTENDSP
jgi:hypothetical protein